MKKRNQLTRISFLKGIRWNQEIGGHVGDHIQDKLLLELYEKIGQNTFDMLRDWLRKHV